MRIIRIIDRDTGNTVPFTTTPARRSKMERPSRRSQVTMGRVARRSRGVADFLNQTAAMLIREAIRRLR